MADESTRSEIITLTRVLRSDMRSVLDQLTKDRMTLNDFERFSVPWRNCLHGVTAGESLRREYLAMLHKLVGMVYQHLPGEGRNLRELSRVDEPDGWDWDAAAGELRGIEVAALAATNTPATDTSPVEVNANPPSDAFLSPKQLADLFHVPQEPLESRLKRWREKNAAGDGWIEHDKPTRNEPRFMYRVRSVQDVISSLKSATDGDGRTTDRKKPTH
jgi:hypothetical protein